MYLAINYSPSAARLLASGEIEIDYFKIPNWDWIVEEARRLKPVAVHFTLEAGNNSLAQVDWEKVGQLAQSTATPYINLHLDARQYYYPDLSVDTTRPAEVERVYKIILSDVLRAVKHFGPERVIIENSPYQGLDGNTMFLCVEAGLITRLIKETGCGLLLDLSHAIITAKFLAMEPDEYISQLPVQKVKEMHFAGIHRHQTTGLMMDHLSIQAEDWHWLDWALSCIRSGVWNCPWLLAFEYGGVGEPFEWRSNPEVIAEQVPKLYQHIKLLNV